LREDVQTPVGYATGLAAAWTTAQAPRSNTAPTVVSLFAGCGGSSLGYAMAGFDERLAVEWDDHAAETFRTNFPDIPLYHGDIQRLSATEALTLARLKPGELDVLDGSPPCQGFSVAGNRIIEDPRNQLFREYLRVIDIFKPKVIVMENVSGMVRGEMKLVFAEILKTMRNSGYRVAARILNAMWYGVPQSRQRIIFVGIRNDLEGTPGHPSPSVTTPYTFIDACQGIESVGPVISIKKGVAAYSLIKRGGGMAIVLTDLGARHSHFSWRRLSWTEPCPTICTQRALLHPDTRAFLSIAAIKRCSSFPDKFIFNGTLKNQWARIGNSVPPLFIRAIATHIKEILLTNAMKTRDSFTNVG